MDQIPQSWQDYELLDFGNGEKLERFGKFVLRRPDQNALRKKVLSSEQWKNADLYFERTSKESGVWKRNNALIPDKWMLNYKSLIFVIKPTKYKHVGLFPEQAVNWDWIIESISHASKSEPERKIKVLNLFAYTGGSSLAASLGGADEVVHVDSSKGANAMAKENQISSGLERKKIRFITEDVKKFVVRELKRGNKYDAIIMDPPLYGRGPNGELWKIEKDLMPLISDCTGLLTEHPLFFIINLYTGSNLKDKLQKFFKDKIVGKYKGVVNLSALGLEALDKKTSLQCGDLLKWHK